MTLRGRVAEYDFHKGYGFVEAEGEDGGRWFFHCTAIADGSRDIPEGIDVEFEVVLDPRGKPEATAVTPVPGAGQEPGPAELIWT